MLQSNSHKKVEEVVAGTENEFWQSLPLGVLDITEQVVSKTLCGSHDLVRIVSSLRRLLFVVLFEQFLDHTMAEKRPHHELDVSEVMHIFSCKKSRIHAAVTSLSPVKVSPNKTGIPFFLCESDQQQAATLNAVLVFHHWMSVNKKWRYFEAKVLDRKKTLKAVSFDPDRHW